jgi:hypothetical protein
MKELLLTQGKVALVDDEDFEYVSQWKWHAQRDRGTWYAKRRDGTKLHRIIMKTPVDLEVDHRDKNGLNCQKYNMRNCTHSQNMHNRNFIGKYKGVWIHKASGRWTSFIQGNGK